MYLNNQFTTSIWGDEGFSAILSMKSIPEIISIIIRDTSPPLYNITEHIAFQLFGTSEVVIRGLSFFYWIIALFFVYKIANYFWDRKTAVLAVVLSGLNPFFFIYAFEGRMYSILALGVTASMYFFVRLVNEKKSSRTDLIGYILATTWALYSHHFAIFALFVQGIWFLWQIFKHNFQKVKLLLKAFIAVGILYSPWLLPLYWQTSKVGGGFWLGTPTVKDLLGLFGRYLGAGIPHTLANVSLGFVVTGLAIREWFKNKFSDLFFLSWFILPILFTYLISQVFTSVFFDRYLLYAIPGAMLLLASNRREKISPLLIGIILGLFITIDFHYFITPTKRPFKEFSQLVKTNLQEGDFIVNWNSSSHHIWETKYYGIGGPIYLPKEGELPYFVGTALMGDDDIIYKIPSGVKRVAAVTTGPVDEVQIDGYTETSYDSVGDIKVVWLEK